MKRILMLFLLLTLIVPFGVLSCEPSYVELGLHITTENCVENDNLRYSVYVKREELPEEYKMLLSSTSEWVSISGLNDFGDGSVYKCETVFDYYGILIGNDEISSFYVELYKGDELISTSPRYSNDINPKESDIWTERQQYRIVYDYDTDEFSLLEDDFREIIECPGSFAREEFAFPLILVLSITLISISVVVSKRRNRIDK